MLRITSCRFLLSSTDVKKMGPHPAFEFAFIGRSNVGKSSLINALTQRKNLAKTSATPGKTALINVFKINEKWNLVDLPGYGFAKRSKSEQQKFTNLIQHYCTERHVLTCLFILIDIRHELQQIDAEFITWVVQHQLPFALIFTKADKLGKQKAEAQLKYFEQKLNTILDEAPNMFMSSALYNTGVSEILNFMGHVMQVPTHE
ncbi:MAG: ribosome biogenesis GTP-binding protein YihA/YsxC [Bacteroidia bacterium]